MQLRRLVLVAAATASALMALPVRSASATTPALTSSEHIITTLYAYPTLPSWAQVNDNAPTISASIVNMCADDGTGSGCDGMPWDEQPPAVWTTEITDLENAGITPLIYIATDYGDESGTTPFSLATVESEVSAAVGWYGKGVGFMFDEGATSCALESSYYLPLYNYVKSHTNGGTVEINPGTVSSTMSCYMSATDILQPFEGTEASFQTATFPAWMASYPSRRFAATVSAGTSAGVGTDVTDAGKDGIGNIYVDDEAEPPNYSTLPAFWSAELTDVAAAAPSSTTLQHIVTPLYAAPTSSYWSQVENAASTQRAAIVDICAPDGSGSGCNGSPADAANPAWPPTVSALRGAGVLPLYYISTNFAATPLATVESEVSNAITWYNTPSIFFDQVPTSCANVSYYQSLYSYVHNLGGIVVLDPGTVSSTSSCYMPAADILQVFSGSQTAFQSATFPAWMASYPSSRFGAVISAGTSAGAGTDVSDAAADRIGNVYIDDETGTPTYATLPAFWSTEVSDVKAEP